MRLPPLFFAIIVIGVFDLPGSNAVAQDADSPLEVVADEADLDARTLFEAGLVAYNEARFRVALVNFQSAYELSSRPQLLFNIGLAQERLGDDEAALESFQLYLATATEGTDRPSVERRVAVIRRRLESRPMNADNDEARSRTPGWLLLASGTALTVGGVVALGVGLSKRSSVTRSMNGELEWPDAEARFDRGSALTVAGVISTGVGLALTAVSVVLLRGSRETTVSTNGSMLFVSGRL